MDVLMAERRVKCGGGGVGGGGRVG